MSAAILSRSAWPVIHRQFEAVLPEIDRAIRSRFHTLPRWRREEAIADARAAAWHAWHGLLVRGKDPLSVSPTGVAYNACRYVLAGRRLGTGRCGRSSMDVYNPRARRCLGCELFSLDQVPRERPGQERDAWREWLAADNRCTPAEEAAFRIDFASWLESLPRHKRRMAELLAEGHETGFVASLLHVTPSAISQTRSWLAESWSRFQALGVLA